MSDSNREGGKGKGLLDNAKLSLRDLRVNLVGPKDRCRTLYETACTDWGRYFQSPVDKAARSLIAPFSFDGRGAFVNDNLIGAKKSLLDWLYDGDVSESEEKSRFDAALMNWLKTGEPFSQELLHSIKRRLKEESLTPESLYDQPICRLVHRSQLRRDLDYRVIYQLTPGQSRLLDPTNRAKDPKAPRQNQAAYWGISEMFQSLVAMFDSDLGTVKPRQKLKKGETREFIRINVDQKTRLAPAELNQYSPLRFWSPPPSFAGSVFHMLFWRAIITGKDLFGRSVYKEEFGGTVDQRVGQYYVAINWFNAAKYRLANYDKLVELLMVISTEIKNLVKKRNPCLNELRDIHIKNKALTSLLYPNYFAESNVRFATYPRLELTLPFSSLKGKFIWELAWGHHAEDEKTKPTKVSHLLRFLRDKTLELIIWSKYQMEIRSVGLIPIDYLYRIDLDEELIKDLKVMSKEYKAAKGKGNLENLFTRINDTVSNGMRGGAIDSKVKLIKVYGGAYRTVFDSGSVGRIDKLRRKAWPSPSISS